MYISSGSFVVLNVSKTERVASNFPFMRLRILLTLFTCSESSSWSSSSVTSRSMPPMTPLMEFTGASSVARTSTSQNRVHSSNCCACLALWQAAASPFPIFFRLFTAPHILSIAFAILSAFNLCNDLPGWIGIIWMTKVGRSIFLVLLDLPWRGYPFMHYMYTNNTWLSCVAHSRKRL